MIAFANRLKDTSEYYFSKKLKEVKAMNQRGHDVLNLGIGSPDLSPPQQVFSGLTEAMKHPSAFQYQPYLGIDELRTSVASFYQEKYQVSLNLDAEILPLMGSKEGIMMVSLAFLNPGDEVLIPQPGYPTYQAVTQLVEAKPRMYSLQEELNWYPDLEELKKMDLSKVKLMWINYPNMPTGAKAHRNKTQDLVDFALEHQIVLVNDNPYSMILTQDYFSIFQLKNASKIALELNSLSKSYNLAGFRTGFLLGNANFIEAVLKVKSNIDSGMFYPIQKVASMVLQLDENWFKQLNKTYQKRRELIWEIADVLNLTYNKESVGLFVWAKVASTNKASVVADQLLYEAKVFITPGKVFGDQKDQYLRFSLCVSVAKIQQALSRIIQNQKKDESL